MYKTLARLNRDRKKLQRKQLNNPTENKKILRTF